VIHMTKSLDLIGVLVAAALILGPMATGAFGH
jgi:hypothetical protein